MNRFYFINLIGVLLGVIIIIWLVYWENIGLCLIIVGITIINLPPAILYIKDFIMSPHISEPYKINLGYVKGDYSSFININEDTKRSTNCHNCGAPITSSKCDYCGTNFEVSAMWGISK